MDKVLNRITIKYYVYAQKMLIISKILLLLFLITD